MSETLFIPDDLETCQQLLRERWEAHRRLREIHAELWATCTSMQDSQEKLEQEKETLEQTIKSLMHRLYGRRSERLPSSPDLLPLDFGDGEPSEIVQAERAANLIPGGSFGFGLAAEVLFNKFGLPLPLYRQQDPFAQLGWVPSRSTLSQIIANAAELLRPLALLETQRILASGVINTDDTPVTLLTRGEGKGSRQARFWIYRSSQAGACEARVIVSGRVPWWA